MELIIYQVDAFSSRPFAGNPAAVCPVEEWPADHLLQSIAAENNLSETAFIGPDDDGLMIRWFTPTAEVDLCGHATLAAASVLFSRDAVEGPVVAFASRSGTLSVVRLDDGRLEMDFPAWPAEQLEVTLGISQTLGAVPTELWHANYYMAVFADEDAVRALTPDLKRIAQLDAVGLIATAPAGQGGGDFVSRFFAPRVGVPEDPATGSAHCALAPYWARRLGKNSLYARQVSARGGELWCVVEGDRVRISGHAVEVMSGVLRF
ncbi:MAG: PhzF family phenazine biosynthesis protein [Xanthomonadaceae bacterium]|nr:PhzF family phenazine biosynthesis protein [Xanthomonadaceae bacterium]